MDGKYIPYNIIISLTYIRNNKMSDICKPKVTETDLVSNVSGANNLDANLINAWGIVIHDNHIWVNANNADLLIRYNLDGSNPFYIGFYDELGIQLPTSTVNPTGIVVNHTNGYLVSDGTKTRKSTFLISSESGDLFGYTDRVGGGNKAYRIYNGSNVVPSPVYKGLAVTHRYLFAVDFLHGNIDVFSDVGNVNSIDLNVHINKYPLVGPNFAAPFNIVHLNDVLYVLYANKDSARSTDDSNTNPGGFIDIHNDFGIFIKHFNNTDPSFASPWALIASQASSSFGQRNNPWGCNCGDILVGNFQSGIINIYDKCGNHIGKIYSKITDLPLIIDGLWGLYNYDLCERIYFAAGPADETNGLVGYLQSGTHSCKHHKHKSCES